MTPSSQWFAQDLIHRLDKFDRSTPIEALSAAHRAKARAFSTKLDLSHDECIEAAAIVNLHASLFPPLLIARMNGKLNAEQKPKPPAI